MLVGPGQVVTYLYWIQEVQRLGLDNTTTPGLHERRMFDESGRYKLYAWNGTEWKLINDMTDQELLNLIKNVDGSGSGFDADLLDGQEGSFYQNANNLNAGSVPRARLGSLGYDNINNNNTYPYIQWGDYFSPTSGYPVMTFDYAFTSAPVVTATQYEANDGKIRMVQTRNCSTTGVWIALFDNTNTRKSGHARWICIGKKT